MDLYAPLDWDRCALATEVLARFSPTMLAREGWLKYDPWVIADQGGCSNVPPLKEILQDMFSHIPNLYDIIGKSCQ